MQLRQLLPLTAASVLALGCGDLDVPAMSDDGMGDAGTDGEDAGDADGGDEADGDAGHDGGAGEGGHDGGDDGQFAYDDGGDDAGHDGGEDGDDDDDDDDDDDGCDEGEPPVCNSDDPCDCPDSPESIAGECDEVCTHWFATAADAHPQVAAHAGGHAIWAPEFYCDGGTTIFDFEDVTVQLTDTGATMSGTAFVVTDGCGGEHDGRTWQLDVALADGPDSMMPKLELANPGQTQPPVVTDEWLYFAFLEGEATMVDPENGATATFSHRPADLTYGFQLGYTANGKNLEFGASGWFFFEHHGECGKRTGIGDFNVDLHALCE